MALTDGLRISLPFNNDWLDKSGNGNDVTPSGITFDGVDKKLGSDSAEGDGFSDGEIADSTSLDADYITFAYWIKYTTSNVTIILERSSGIYSPNDWDMLTVSNALRFQLIVGGNNGFVETPLGYADGNWHLVVAMYDGIARRLFIDNVYVAEVAAAHGAIGASINPLTLFARKGAVIPFPGNLDSFLMWGRALDFGGVTVGNSATGELAEIWNGGTGIEISEIAVNGSPFFFDAGHY